MATDDIQRLVTGTAATPATFTIPGNGQIRPKSVFATFDGTSAAVPFLPALKVTSDAGKPVGIYAGTTSVAAGGSANVSWFPRVGGGGGSGGNIAPLDLTAVTFGGGNLVVTGTTLGTATTVITASPVTFGGAQEVQLQFFVGTVDCGLGAHTGQQALVMGFRRNGTSLGVSFNYNPSPAAYGSTECYMVQYDTPPAGATTYSVFAFTTVTGGSAGTANVYAATLGPPTFDQAAPATLAIYGVS